MNSLKFIFLLSISLLCIQLHSQTACVEELAKIYESNFINVRIEPSGNLSYVSGESIISSHDDGVTWNETAIPRHLNAPSRKGLENGNYIWHTDSTMYYQENDTRFINTEDLVSTSKQMTLDINPIPTGIYYLEVTLVSGARSVVKFVKVD